MRGVIAKFGPRCFFCNLEGHFKSDCRQFWDAVADIKHPRHEEALSGVKASKACLLSESEARRKDKPQELATKKMQAVTEETCEPEPVTAADDFKINNRAAARDAHNRVQQELVTTEIEQKMKLELENEELQEQLNTFEATEVEETKAPSSLSMKLNVISGQRFGMVPQGSKIPSIISVAGHQVIRTLSEPSEFTLMHLDTYADYLRQVEPRTESKAVRALLTTGGPRIKKLHGCCVEVFGPYQVMLNVGGISIYTRTYVTTDSDQTGQIYLGEEELKVRRIGHDAMMEQDAVHIEYEADVTAHLLDTNGKKIGVALMRMLGGLLEREVTREDPEWAAAMASLTVREKVETMPLIRQHKDNERDCRSIVQQLVSSIPQEVLISTSYGRKEQGNDTRKKTVTFEDQDGENEKVERNLEQDCLSGETNGEKSRRVRDQHPGQGTLSGESEIDEKVPDKRQDPGNKILSWESEMDEKIPDKRQDLGKRILSEEFRWMRRRHGPDLEEGADSITDSSLDDNSRNSGIDTYSDSNSSSGSELSELAIHTLLVETRAKDLDREVYQDPDSDRYLTRSERVFNNAADDLETIAVSKRSIRLLPQKEVVRTDLQPFKQETQPLAKIWCVKMKEDTHQPNEMNSQTRVMKTYLKARYRLSDLLRAQRNDGMTSNLKRWIENGAPDKGDWTKTVTVS